MYYRVWFSDETPYDSFVTEADTAEEAARHIRSPITISVCTDEEWNAWYVSGEKIESLRAEEFPPTPHPATPHPESIKKILGTTRLPKEVLAHLEKKLWVPKGCRVAAKGSEIGELAIAEFQRWRDDIDELHACDTFDLALGWFSGKGYGHRDSCDTAAILANESLSDIQNEGQEEKSE